MEVFKKNRSICEDHWYRWRLLLVATRNSPTSGIIGTDSPIDLPNIGKVLGCSGFSQANGTNIFNRLPWRAKSTMDVHSKGHGYYELTAKHSGKCLDYQIQQASGTNIIQQDCHGGPNHNGRSFQRVRSQLTAKIAEMLGRIRFSQASDKCHSTDCHGWPNQL